MTTQTITETEQLAAIREALASDAVLRACCLQRGLDPEVVREVLTSSYYAILKWRN